MMNARVRTKSDARVAGVERAAARAARFRRDLPIRDASGSSASWTLRTITTDVCCPQASCRRTTASVAQQELAHFSNDQGFFHDVHVMVRVR